MKAKSSVLVAFVLGAICAATPFVLSRGNVEAHGKPAPTVDSNASSAMVIDSVFVYVLNQNKVFRFEKANLSSKGTPAF